MAEIESSLEERVFAALSDSRRRQLLEKLAQGESKTTTELANELPITRQGVAKHSEHSGTSGACSCTAQWSRNTLFV